MNKKRKIKFSHSDLQHLEEAEGWLGLADFVQANAELDKITPELRAHPEVLKARYEIFSKAKKWDAALMVSTALKTMLPDDPYGWIYTSYCLHELKRTEEARDNLLLVAEKFTQEPILFYNLACYECQLRRLKIAEEYFHKALKVGNPKKLRLMALHDPDLAPLLGSIDTPK